MVSMPDKDNKYYLLTKEGGWNPCIDVTAQKDNNGVVYPFFRGAANCVWWAVGRFNELAKAEGCRWLGNTNAKSMVDLAKRQGLTVTDQPVPGGVMCWDDGKYGHVEVVEFMSTDKKTCYDSSSAYATYVLKEKVRKYSSGGAGQWGWTKPTKYLGCINPPIKETEKPKLEGTLEINNKKYKVILQEML